MRRALTVVPSSVAVAAGLALAGCGGGDSDAPSKAEFVKQADAICKKAHDRFQKKYEVFVFSQGVNVRPTEAQLERFAETTLVPGVQGEIDDIGKLEQPSGDEGQIDAILEAEQTGVDKVKANPAILSPSVKEDPLAKGQQLAKEYGMKECST